MVVSINYEPGWTEGLNWLVYLGFAFSFILAFGGGANDTANSFGVVVGSGVLKLWQAYILAAVFDTIGGALLGYTVTEAIQKMIVDVDVYTVYARNATGMWNTSTTSCTLLNGTNITEAGCMPYTSGRFMVGELGAMIGSASWQILATIFSMPVSTTQSTVGGTVGFSLALKGAKGINWIVIIRTAASWVISPIMSGCISSIFYLIIKTTVLAKEDPYESSLIMLPFFFAFTVMVIIFAVVFNGSKYLGLDKLLWWEAALISVGCGVLVALLVKFFFIKYIRKNTEHFKERSLSMPTEMPIAVVSANELQIMPSIKEEESDITTFDSSPHKSTLKILTNTCAPSHLNVNNELVRMRTDSLQVGNGNNKRRPWKLLEKVQEDYRTVRVFHYLQILSACYLSFSHGTNDTANAVGPLVGMWVTWVYGYAGTDVSGDYRLLLLLLFGTGSGIVGVVCLAHRVIKTLGKDVTTVSAPSGLCMELGAAFTILVGSKLRIPLSTTHCMVGSVTCVGWLRNREPLRWKLLSKIAISWLVTLPVAGGVSALVAWGLTTVLFDPTQL